MKITPSLKTKLLLSIFFVSTSVDSFAQVPGSSIMPNPLGSRLRIDSTLTDSILVNNFFTSKKTGFITKIVFADLLKRTGSGCLAKPGERFNETDLKLGRWCNTRLVISGCDQNKNIYFVIYQTGSIGGLETNCIMYKLKAGELISYLNISFRNNINTLNKLRRIIRERCLIFHFNASNNKNNMTLAKIVRWKKNNMKPKTFKILLAAFIVSLLSSSHAKQAESRHIDCVPDKETALKIAETILVRIYGRQVENEKPFNVTLIDDNIWSVSGTLPAGYFGGVAYIQIQKYDCKILKVYHTR